MITRPILSLMHGPLGMLDIANLRLRLHPQQLNYENKKKVVLLFRI